MAKDCLRLRKVWTVVLDAGVDCLKGGATLGARLVGCRRALQTRPRAKRHEHRAFPSVWDEDAAASRHPSAVCLKMLRPKWCLERRRNSAGTSWKPPGRHSRAVLKVPELPRVLAFARTPCHNACKRQPQKGEQIDNLQRSSSCQASSSLPKHDFTWFPRCLAAIASCLVSPACCASCTPCLQHPCLQSASFHEDHAQASHHSSSNVLQKTFKRRISTSAREEHESTLCPAWPRPMHRPLLVLLPRGVAVDTHARNSCFTRLKKQRGS